MDTVELVILRTSLGIALLLAAVAQEAHGDVMFSGPSTRSATSPASRQIDEGYSEYVPAPSDADTVPSSSGDEITERSQHTPVSESPPSAAWLSFLAAVLVAAVMASINIWYYRHQLRQKDVELEAARLQKLLDTFYGPLLTLKRASRNLHDLLKTRIAPDGSMVTEEWRTLERLLEGHEFDKNDKTLVELILAINEEIDRLIGQHSGLIGSLELGEKIQSLRTHYRLIRAAYEGQLVGEVVRFACYVYPTGLDELLEEEVSALQERLKSLR